MQECVKAHHPWLLVTALPEPANPERLATALTSSRVAFETGAQVSSQLVGLALTLLSVRQSMSQFPKLPSYSCKLCSL